MDGLDLIRIAGIRIEVHPRVVVAGRHTAPTAVSWSLRTFESPNEVPSIGCDNMHQTIFVSVEGSCHGLAWSNKSIQFVFLNKCYVFEFRSRRKGSKLAMTTIDATHAGRSLDVMFHQSDVSSHRTCGND